MCRELAKNMYIQCKNYPFKLYNVTDTLGVVFHAQVVTSYYSTLWVTGQDVLGHVWALRMSSYWAETHIIDVSILYVYCVTALLQEIIGNESNCRVSNIGLDHSLVIHLHGHFQETKPVVLFHI